MAARKKKRRTDDRPKADQPVVAGASAIVTGIVLAVVGSFELVRAAGVAAAIVLTADVLLLGSRWWSLRRARKKYDVRGRPSRYGWLLTAAVAVVAAGGLLPWIDQGIRDAIHDVIGSPPERAWPYQGMAVTVGVCAAVIHVSAMIDWAFIRLRLRGTLGDWAMPCQSAKHTMSSNWPLLTRLWLGHRLTAYVVVRIGIVAFVCFVAVAIVDPANVGVSSPMPDIPPPATDGPRPTTDPPKWLQPAATALGAVAAAILVFFINRLLPSWALLLNPRVSVGDRVVLAEEFGTGVTARPVYFVVDIAVEGIKLLELDEGDQPLGAAGRDPRREHDRSLLLTDIPRLLRFRGRFSACDEVCCRVQHYCPLRHGNPVDWPAGAEPGERAVDRAAEPEGAFEDHKGGW